MTQADSEHSTPRRTVPSAFLSTVARIHLSHLFRDPYQEKSWRQASLFVGSDRELDDCDREDDDPAELGEVSGIGDWDGMLERIGGHHSFHGRVID
jgi:hypothetical protein